MKPLSDRQLALIVERARALSDPTRVRLLAALARGESPVNLLATTLQTDPSLISKHLQVLFHARLVDRRRVASTVIYSIASLELMEWCRFLGAADLGRAIRFGSSPTYPS